MAIRFGNLECQEVARLFERRMAIVNRVGIDCGFEVPARRFITESVVIKSGIDRSKCCE